MSRQSCLSLCRNRVNLPSQHKFQDMGLPCRDSEARHYVAARLRARDKDVLSRQCDAVLRRDRESHACSTD